MLLAIFSLSLLLGVFTSSSLSAADEAAAARPDFEEWLVEVRQEALDKGITPATVEAALGQVTQLERIIALDRNQPEFKQTYDAYLKARLSPWRVETGLRMMADHQATLAAVSQTYGIQPRFVAAIWGIETNYGTVELSYSVFDALATMAHEGRRESFFKAHLFAALTILDQGHAGMDLMKSSWAGAMGQPQFMPEIYLRYAEDFDGDGRRNIWTSKPDVFASIAKHLTDVGWLDDETWGRPVLMPEGGLPVAPAEMTELTPSKNCTRFTKSLGAWRSLADWQALGVRRLSHMDLPTRDIPAAFIPPEDGGNKGYIVYRNFCTIMWYNASFKYAIGVGMLGDRIRDGAQ
jgi:membrane-bound lytic murein transglycosylase B